MVKTYTWPLLDGFNEGDMVAIKGSLPTGGSAFSINFLSGSDFDDSDIIFHMASRYSLGQIVFNTKNKGGNWMNEETYKDVQVLTAGKSFNILIALQASKFM
ncbi:putative galectin, partial [Trypoxylus dichotomus]